MIVSKYFYLNFHKWYTKHFRINLYRYHGWLNFEAKLPLLDFNIAAHLFK